MGLFGLVKKKRTPNHTFSDEDRQASAELRRYKSDLKKQELEIEKLKIDRKKLEMQAEIEDLKEELFGEDEEDISEARTPEDLLMPILMKVLSGGNQQENVQNEPPQQQEINLSDEEIKEFLESQPKSYIKQAKKIPDSMLKKLIEQQVPVKLNEDTINRAIKIVKS
jgi:hypothetical protein